MSELCEETFTLDTGHLKCDLKAGHAGPHKDIAPGDAVWWQKNYRLLTADGQPWHIDTGLLTVGARIMKDSWDEDDATEDDDD